MSRSINYINTDILFDEEIFNDPGFEGIIVDGIPHDVNLIETFTKIVHKKSLETTDDLVLLDVGANIGTFSMMPKYIPNLKVYAIEPINKTFNFLKSNIKLNNLESKVFPHQCVFSENDNNQYLDIRIPFYKNRHSGYGLVTLGKNPLRFLEYTTEKVKNTTMDKFCAENNINKIDFIKIDTEGYEYFILQGGKNIIETYHPTILSEFNDTNAKQCGSSLENLYNLIKSFGYKTIIRMSDEDILCIYDQI